MGKVNVFLAAIGLAAQIIFFAGVVFLVSDLYGLRYVVTPAMEEDLMLLAPYIGETVYSYWPFHGTGFLGAMLTFVLVSIAGYRAVWFLWCTRLLCWLWMPLIPIGTLIGVVLLTTATRAANSRHGAE